MTIVNENPDIVVEFEDQIPPVVVDMPDQNPIIEVVFSEIGLVGPPGPPGPPGAPGNGLVHEQTTPSSSWSFTHPLNRLPGVIIYVGNELVDADVVADSSSISITFPYPVTGTAVLV